jgi:hypothetical protein
MSSVITGHCHKSNWCRSLPRVKADSRACVALSEGRGVMSGAHGDCDMGHTVAGWTGTAVSLAGFATAGAAMCGASLPGIVLGVGLIGLGALVAWGLHLMGWGKPTGPRPRDEWDWRRRDPMTGHANCLGCRLAGRIGRPQAVPAIEAPKRVLASRR